MSANNYHDRSTWIGTAAERAACTPLWGAYWIETDTGDLYMYYSNAWHLVGGTGVGPPTEGPGIDIVGTQVGLGGDTILLYHSDLSPVEEFVATGAGLTSALAAAVSGDIVIIPAGTIAGNQTVPAGINLIGLSENSILSGTITNNGILSNIQIAGTLTNNATLQYIIDPQDKTQTSRGLGVGISPRTEIHVDVPDDAAAIRVSSPSDHYSSLQLYTRDGSNYSGWVVVKEQTSEDFCIDQDHSESNVDHVPFRIDKDTLNTGIGEQSNPKEKLHVNGNIRNNRFMYLASSFRMIDESMADLLLLGSNDGIIWNFLAPIKFYTAPGVDALRDPSIMRYNDVYWVCHSYAVDTFNVINSPDLQNWTFVANPDMSSIPDIGHVYAPEWFIDSDDSVHVFVSCNDGDPVAGFKIYELHPTNESMTTWSEPVEVTGVGLPSSAIDPYMIKIGATYYLWYKDNTTEYICYATSASLTSGYTEIKDGNWAAWGNKKEAPSILMMEDGSYRIYGQDYNSIPGEYIWYSDSDDLLNWSAPAKIVSPWRIMHSTILPVYDYDTLRHILAIYLSQPGGERWFSNTEDAGLTINAGINSTAGNQISYLKFMINEVLKATIKVDESTTGNPLEILANILISGYIDYPEIASPSSPASNIARVYSKDDSGTTKLYYKRSDGTELEVGSGSILPTDYHWEPVANGDSASPEMVFTDDGDVVMVWTQ